MGTLWDEEANPVDVVGMMIDLAVRGYFRIEEIATPQRSSFGFGQTQGDYRFVKLKDPDDTLAALGAGAPGVAVPRRRPGALSELQQHFATPAGTGRGRALRRCGRPPDGSRPGPIGSAPSGRASAWP